MIKKTIMLAVSTKQLRNNFPKIVEQLKQGVKFLLIHKSVPIAEIKRPEVVQSFSEAAEEDIEKSALSDISKDFLSSKELNYYLSLK